MKKSIFIFIAVLVVLFVILSIAGSRSEYMAEKLLYKADKLYSQIVTNPDVVPPKLLDAVEKDLLKVIARFPKTVAANTAYMKLVEIYMNDKRSDEAIEKLDELIDSGTEDLAVLSKAHFLKAVIYEKEDDWASALAEFAVLQDQYVDTLLGIQAPLYVAEHYAAKKMTGETQAALQDALAFYRKLEEEGAGKISGYLASVMLMDTYYRLGDYAKAGEVVERILDSYPSAIAFAQLIPLIDKIYIESLNDVSKAIYIYNSVINKTEDEALKKALRDKIAELEGGE